MLSPKLYKAQNQHFFKSLDFFKLYQMAGIKNWVKVTVLRFLMENLIMLEMGEVGHFWAKNQHFSKFVY